MAEQQESAQQFAKRNRLYQQKMLMLRQKVQQVQKRSSNIPKLTQHNVHKINTNENSGSVSINTNNYQSKSPKSFVDSVIEPSHDYSSTPKHINNESKYKQFDYNSTLFRNIREDEQSNKTQDFLQNYSSASGVSGLTPNYNQNYEQADKQLLSNVDQILEKVKRSQNHKNSALENFLSKNSVKNSSDISNYSENQSGLDLAQEFSHKHSYTPSNLTQRSHPNTKLKTIQQQKNLQTFTIDRDQQDKRTKNKKPNKNFPPLASANTIQRQKKKLQETMSQRKKIQHHEQQYNQKESIIFDLSDNQSDIQIEHRNNVKEQQQKKQLQSQQIQNQNKQKRKQILLKEKESLRKQLGQIEQKLQELEDDDSDFQ